MSKIAYICFRDTRRTLSSEELATLEARLLPDNAPARMARIVQGSGVAACIVNPAVTVGVQQLGICMGQFFEAAGDWYAPGGARPEGSYALFRADQERVEVATDAAASRTVWYTKTTDLFVAATSQRAIVFLLKSFVPNPAAYPWFLSTGTLCFGQSWDSRIHCLPPDSLLTLDRDRWRVDIKRTSIPFEPQRLAPAEHERRLRGALEKTFRGIDLTGARWVLPLSGGFDSRCILLMTRDRASLPTLTWGAPHAPRESGSDAEVASRLAREVGIQHRYHTLTLGEEPFETVIGRFLRAGEGRTDRISGYVDGLRIWADIAREYSAVLRGDEVFGCRAVRTRMDVLRNLRLFRLVDYAGLDDFAALFSQRLPDGLRRHGDESLATWRDRLNAEYEMPSVFGALNDLKLAYVEVIAPLLSREIVRVVRAMPDGLRTEKFLFKRIVRRASPPVPFARTAAIAPLGRVLRSSAVRRVLTQTLEDLPAGWLPAQVMEWCRRLGKPDAVSERGHTPFWQKAGASLSGKRPRPQLDPLVLAFRVILLHRTQELMAEDALWGARQTAVVESATAVAQGGGGR